MNSSILEKNLKDSLMKVKKRKSLVNCNFFSPIEIILEVKKCSSCGGDHIITPSDYNNVVFVCPQNKQCVEYTIKE